MATRTFKVDVSDNTHASIVIGLRLLDSERENRLSDLLKGMSAKESPSAGKRGLSSSQRAAIAAKGYIMETLYTQEGKSGPKKGALPQGRAIERAAKIAGTSATNLQRAVFVRDRDMELLDKVIRGEASCTAARKALLDVEFGDAEKQVRRRLNDVIDAISALRNERRSPRRRRGRGRRNSAR